jgi:MYXO-CTERM domain-containing protein
MERSFYVAAFGMATFGAAITLTSVASADTITLFNDCSYEYGAGCSTNCTSGSMNCTAEYADVCSKSCTETPTKTCTTSCEKECTTNPGSFSCTSYCSDQCESECNTNGNFGAQSQTDCVTGCQAQCSYSCNVTPPSTTCSTQCDTTCKASENISCSVKCQVEDSKTCTITPATCSESCSGTGGVIVCNGQVVYVAGDIAEAGQWYISHLDAQFDVSKFTLSASGACSGSECMGSVSCAAAPGQAHPEGGALFLAGVGLIGFAVYRRRRAA